jgi:serine protease Do
MICGESGFCHGASVHNPVTNFSKIYLILFIFSPYLAIIIKTNTGAVRPAEEETTMNDNYDFNPNEGRGDPNQCFDLVMYKPKRRKRKTPLLKIVAVMLACMLLGTAGGALGTHLYLHLSPAAETLLPSLERGVPSAIITNLTSSHTDKLSLQEIYANSNPSVVAVAIEISGRNTFGQTVNLPSAGSGFVISSDGYIVTNNHVVEGASTIKIQMSDGKSYDAEVVGTDSYTDLAVLKIDAKGLRYLTFGNSDSLLVGNQVSAIGNPLGQFANTFTVGYISALHREINIDGIPRTMLQTDAALNRGNSGGPLFNEYGFVIGVVTAKSGGSDVEGLGFAIPSNIAGDIVQQLIDNGYVKGRPFLGISAQSRMPNFALPVLEVTSVEPGSGADKAGIEAGDYIIEVDGTRVATREALLGALYRSNVGDTIKVKIQRGNQVINLDVTLGEKQY